MSPRNFFWGLMSVSEWTFRKITSPGDITLTHSVFLSVLTGLIFLLKFNQRLLFQSQDFFLNFTKNLKTKNFFEISQKTRFPGYAKQSVKKCKLSSKIFCCET